MDNKWIKISERAPTEEGEYEVKVYEMAMPPHISEETSTISFYTNSIGVQLYRWQNMLSNRWVTEWRPIQKKK